MVELGEYEGNDTFDDENCCYVCGNARAVDCDVCETCMNDMEWLYTAAKGMTNKECFEQDNFIDDLKDAPHKEKYKVLLELYYMLDENEKGKFRYCIL